MDKITITPCPLSGSVKIPPSKSYAHRAIISAFLSGGDCKIENIKLSDDISATLSCMKALGGEYIYDPQSLTLNISRKTKPLTKKVRLDCLESGSTLRFFIPIALSLGTEFEFSGKDRLLSRPLDPYFKIFDHLGIEYHQTENSLLISGSLKPGKFVIDGSVSSQFVTGLLFALPLLDGTSEIAIDGNLSSKGYIDITLDVLKKFGIKIKNDNYKTFIIEGNQKYKAQNYVVEGDFSQSAFFLVAGALGSDITVSGLNPDSLQGDKKILDIIKETGAKIEQVSKSDFSAICTSLMHGITIDADEVPDLVPVLAVLFAFCKGESRITNASRLRLKESDRLSTTCDVLKKMGADIEEGEDFLVIKGKQTLKGAEVSAHNDHRIAMAAAIAACRCEGDVIIDGAEKAVSKSYPDFFEDYNNLGGNAR
ncbi:MAG: 3-phosphoshikimate 1-carboxyvinyltransferase [Clostridia bacterium]|nr:3-phosphoshikimate 1-carboxyvinyltransferase [Clostridia bacterium]